MRARRYWRCSSCLFEAFEYHPVKTAQTEKLDMSSLITWAASCGMVSFNIIHHILPAKASHMNSCVKFWLVKYDEWYWMAPSHKTSARYLVFHLNETQYSTQARQTKMRARRYWRCSSCLFEAFEYHPVKTAQMEKLDMSSLMGTLSTFCRSLVNCVFSTCLHWEGEDPQKIKAESHGRNKYNSWRPTVAVRQKHRQNTDSTYDGPRKKDKNGSTCFDQDQPLIALQGERPHSLTCPEVDKHRWPNMPPTGKQNSQCNYTGK